MRKRTALGDLEQRLLAYRRLRRFDSGGYVEGKARLINCYLKRYGLSACVVGVSGGVDSALVLALLSWAAGKPDSPIRRVIAALAPIHESSGATNQERATLLGRQVAESYPVEIATVDLSMSQQSLKQAVDRGLKVDGQPWATGQLASYLRTPALYYLAALLAQEGFPAVVCGTTNRDEGAYIGFFGKASDGMVDLQLIGDIHKSEVREAARWLRVPEVVIEAVPTGDTYDGRVDEEMIGAPYDFLELYQASLEGAARLPSGEPFDGWARAVEDLHQRNLHKYLASSPAVFLDIYPRAVPGGWRSVAYPARLASDPRPESLVGEFRLAQWPFQESSPPPQRRVLSHEPSALVLEQLLSERECLWLRDSYHEAGSVPVGKHGSQKNFDPTQESPASWRATAYSPEFAQVLWSRIAESLSPVRIFDGHAFTDWQHHPVWRAVGVNPVFRFIEYPTGGWLVPHYDAGYDFADGRRHTLMSLILYLDDHGATRLLLDGQRHLPLDERCHDDATQAATDHDVLVRVPSQTGTVFLFDHRLLHDAEPWNGPGRRLLLRSDIIFERCGLQPLPSTVTAPQPTPPPEDPFLRRAFRDPYYGAALPLLRDSATVEEAGFFLETRDEPSDERFSADWLVTPLHRVIENLKTAPADGKLAVLITTGAMCPIHPGHIEMMEQARQQLEQRGFTVLGGYLSPSHDEYLQLKCGDDALPAFHRLYLCEQAVKQSDWLMVDPWESLHTSLAVNFTVVLERLASYLSRHVRCLRPIHVVYAFGSDNARFALTFVSRGRGVCVPRDGYERQHRTYAEHLLLRDREEVIFSPGPPVANTASSKVRQGDSELLQADVQLLWLEWQSKKKPPRLRLTLRDEGAWMVAHWPPRADLERARLDFSRKLEELLEEAFLSAGQPIVLQRLTLESQRSTVPEVPAGGVLLSLDPCLPGQYNLAVSRCHSLCDSRLFPGLVSRPNTPELEAQLDQLPAGRYLVFDDDLATGGTTREVLALLPQRCQVERFLHLFSASADQEESSELLDSRDFLVGARESGLVVRLPDDTLARAPYILPYVAPVQRANIPLSSYYRFSREVWRLNRAFFSAYHPELTISQADPAFVGFALYLGFCPETTMVEFCDWHIQRLSGF